MGKKKKAEGACREISKATATKRRAEILSKMCMLEPCTGLAQNKAEKRKQHTSTDASMPFAWAMLKQLATSIQGEVVPRINLERSGR